MDAKSWCETWKKHIVTLWREEAGGYWVAEVPGLEHKGFLLSCAHKDKKTAQAELMDCIDHVAKVASEEGWLLQGPEPEALSHVRPMVSPQGD